MSHKGPLTWFSSDGTIFFLSLDNSFSMGFIVSWVIFRHRFFRRFLRCDLYFSVAYATLVLPKWFLFHSYTVPWFQFPFYMWQMWYLTNSVMSWDISVSKRNGWGLVEWSSIPRRSRNFSAHHHVFQWVLGSLLTMQSVKYSSPSGVEVQNAKSFVTSSLYFFIALCLHPEYFYFYLRLY